MAFSCWRNRMLIDYCQWVTEHPLTRDMGAPFLGTGEKYFSLIDDVEIEVMKALWEGEDYLRIPLPRRVWGTEWIDRQKIWQLAQELDKNITSRVAAGKTTITLPSFGRGYPVILLGQAIRLTRVVVGCDHYPYAVEQLLEFCKRKPDIEYIVHVTEVSNGKAAGE